MKIMGFDVAKDLVTFINIACPHLPGVVNADDFLKHFSSDNIIMNC